MTPRGCCSSVKQDHQFLTKISTEVKVDQFVACNSYFITSHCHFSMISMHILLVLKSAYQVLDKKKHVKIRKKDYPLVGPINPDRNLNRVVIFTLSFVNQQLELRVP